METNILHMMAFQILQSTLFFTCVAFCSFLVLLYMLVLKKNGKISSCRNWWILWSRTHCLLWMHNNWFASMMGMLHFVIPAGTWGPPSGYAAQLLLYFLSFLPLAKLFCPRALLCIFSVHWLDSVEQSVFFWGMTQKPQKPCRKNGCQQQRSYQLLGPLSKKSR